MLHLHVIIFIFIPTGLLKILREQRQDHPYYRQNSSPSSLCCCIIIIGLELNNFIFYFSQPSDTYHLTSHPTPSLMRVRYISPSPSSFATRELKHRTFLIQERHGWPRRNGSGTPFTRQMQIIKQTNVKPSGKWTE